MALVAAALGLAGCRCRAWGYAAAAMVAESRDLSRESRTYRCLGTADREGARREAEDEPEDTP